ncbi:hypothetical protein [Roseibacillus persicicus]|uniref:hypothetical protein n=1 Tax=Roseibacillus persicicus TaxID=454148 RepID=UPI0016766D08|nr:hypothetical protein [Roseibacillus persicicus]
MNVLGVLTCLWKRHRWEILTLVVVSLLLSAMAGKFSLDGGQLRLLWHGLRMDGVVMLEVGLVALVTARVAMSEGAFGSFDGWRSRPLMPWAFGMGSVLLLFLVFAPLLLVRLLVVSEVLEPSQMGWQVLWEKLWRAMISWHLALLVFAYGLGFFLRKIGGKARTQGGWVAVGMMSVTAWTSTPMGGYFPVRSGSAGSGRTVLALVPENRFEVWQEGKWLGRGWDWSEIGTISTSHPSVTTLPLKKGEEKSLEDLKVRIHNVRWSTGSRLRVSVEISRAGGLSRKPLQVEAAVARYGNGYFGVPVQNRHSIAGEQIPFLPLEVVRQDFEILSPLMLPENKVSKEGLLEGAQLSLLIGHWEGQKGHRLDLEELVEEREEPVETVFALVDRVDSNNRNGHSSDAVRRQLELYRDPESIALILQRGPYSSKFWDTTLMAFLAKNVQESHKAQLLKRLKWSPVYGELMVRKGWAEEALPLLKSHLMAGRKVGPQSLLALIALGDKEMGPMLERQILNMHGKVLDTVMQGAAGHPGIDLDRIKREGWRRTKFGFGGDHVRVLWGAEAGDKEALRRMLVKSLDGKTWEKDILENWFAGQGGVTRLEQEWEKVEFSNDRWVIESP